MTDLAREFSEYLDRVERLVGDIKTGQFGRFRNRLVRKLDQEQFQEKIQEYTQHGERLSEAVMNGDTIDERLTVQIRAIEFDLVMEKSRYLP